MAFKEGSSYFAGGGTVVLLGATTVEQTGMLPGETYEFVSTGGTAVIRWGASDAAAADGSFDFSVPPGAVVRAKCPTGITAINIIEAETGSTATAVVTIARIQNV